MTVAQLKFIALIAMIIDHIGLFFFPQLLILRIIGRISFPIFAWLIANGAYHTHNLDGYLKRLLIFAAISQIPYSLAYQQLNPNFSGFNVLFTLSLGLFAIKIFKQFSQTSVKVVAITLICGLAFFLNVDYGIFGVLSVILFYSYFQNFKLLALSQAMILAIIPLIILFTQTWQNIPFLRLSADWYIEPFGLFSLIFIYKYNNQEGFKTKWLLYIFYPLQYLIFFCFRWFFL